MRLKVYILEIFFAQLAIYMLLWLVNDYLSTLISIIFGGICLSILIISLLVEWVEKSGISIWYYQFMVACISAPVSGFLIYLLINQGLDWFNN